jgi:hypothetical protein
VSNRLSQCCNLIGQCRGFGSALILNGWIRIQVDKNDSKKEEKKTGKCMDLKCWVLSLEGWKVLP